MPQRLLMECGACRSHGLRQVAMNLLAQFILIPPRTNGWVSAGKKTLASGDAGAFSSWAMDSQLRCQGTNPPDQSTRRLDSVRLTVTGRWQARGSLPWRLWA